MSVVIVTNISGGHGVFSWHRGFCRTPIPCRRKLTDEEVLELAQYHKDNGRDQKAKEVLENLFFRKHARLQGWNASRVP